MSSIEKGRALDIVFVEEQRKKSQTINRYQFVFLEENEQEEVYQMVLNLWNNCRKAALSSSGMSPLTNSGDKPVLRSVDSTSSLKSYSEVINL